MGKNTPPLDTQAKKKEYIERHLFDELRYMLAAATEWSIQDQLKLEISGYEVQVYAMDSTCLRARTLFESFLEPKDKDFFDKPLESELYKNWRAPLHRFLMHVYDRSKTKKLILSDGSKKELNKMPVHFANEVLRLWKEFERTLGKSGGAEGKQLQKLAHGKREEAIKAAANVVRSEVARCHAGKMQKTLAPVFVFDLTD